MMMKPFTRHIFITLLLLATGYGAWAQIPRNSFRPGNANGAQRFNQAPNAASMQKVESIKESFLEQKMQLSADEAARFWPVYRRYQDELREVLRLKRINNSDAQADGREQIRKNMEYDSRMVRIRERYSDEFLKILPPEKLSKLYKSEREFNDELIRRVGEHQ
ncbi:hypothetical protein CLV57_1182 [Mucilaginibacter auburnensis]|uniref:LTXXQ motif family protein n=2 Tax=Mucilaginibacter auburnensis TaxID=1457233 RepID=A0A2H9VTL9_9SPHI|nr:hypothetical protein CLV57_1182 [Mucilaginibacter auburnensis]